MTEETNDKVVVRQMRYGAPAAQALIGAAMADLAERYGGSGDETPVEGIEFDPPEGAFLIAWLAGEPVGCGGWRTLSHGAEGGSTGEVAEIKRMYVSPAARRRGVATEILRSLEDSAREAGMRRLVLEAGNRQPEAISLYERSGYARIPNYGFYKEAPGCVSFGRDI